MSKMVSLLHCGGGSSTRTEVKYVTKVPKVVVGSKMIKRSGALISLSEALGNKAFKISKIDEEKFILEMAKRLIPRAPLKDLDKCEDLLRELANQVILDNKLMGCFTVSKKRSDEKLRPLMDPKLVFAILSKSTKSIFVASKTPNLSPEIFERELIVNDPRIIKLLGD